MSEAAISKKTFSTAELVYIAVCAALTAVCSWISIPAPAPLAPFTLQTFAVFLVLLLLGGRRGFFTVLTYVLLGAAGLPVFAQFMGGVGVLLGTTGGYIIGFLFTAALYWALERVTAGSSARKIAALVLGLAAALGFRDAEFVGLLGAFGAPTAVNSFTMVQQMHCGDEELAGDIVVATSLVSILSFFIWILVFKSLGVF